VAKWKKRGKIFLDPLFKMVCRGCKDPFASFREMGYALSNFPIDAEHPEKYDSYVIDRTYACELCGYATVFGVAVSSEHFQEILDYEEENSRGEQQKVRQIQFCEVDEN
jgi:hypothetical protein